MKFIEFLYILHTEYSLNEIIVKLNLIITNSGGTLRQKEEKEKKEKKKKKEKKEKKGKKEKKEKKGKKKKKEKK